MRAAYGLWPPSRGRKTRGLWRLVPRTGTAELWSALDDVDGQPAASRLLVLGLHVPPGVAHGLDRLVQADLVTAVAAERQPGGVDRLHAGDRVAFDAGDLDQPADRVAGEAQVVLDADLRGVLDLLRRPAQHLAQRAGGHRAGRSDLTLAADLRAGDGRVLLEQDPDRGRREQEADHPVVVRARHEPDVVVQHR